MNRDEVLSFCEHVKNRCDRAKPLAGATFRGMQVVLCPSWEEKTRLHGQGVLPLHADEMKAMTESSMSRAEKEKLVDLLLRFPGMRFLGEAC